MEEINRTFLEIGVAASTLPGQVVCGDRHVVATFDGGVLLAVIDGVGHGIEAAKVASITEDILKSHPEEALEPLIKRCHEELRGTRGVVMSLASFNRAEKTMTWAGTGNVQGYLLPINMLSPPRSLLLCTGTLGQKLGLVYPTVMPITPGDTLIFATDGLREDFYQDVNLKQPPQQLADEIIARSARQTDDALVLVGRYLV